MAHFAKVENGIVADVLVTDESMSNQGHDWLVETFGGTWVQTSYNTRGGVYYTADGDEAKDQSKALRKNFAGVGFTYDESRDAFIPPQPSEDCVLDEETCLWVCPEV